MCRHAHRDLVPVLCNRLAETGGKGRGAEGKCLLAGAFEPSGGRKAPTHPTEGDSEPRFRAAPGHCRGDRGPEPRDVTDAWLGYGGRPGAPGEARVIRDRREHEISERVHRALSNLMHRPWACATACPGITPGNIRTNPCFGGTGGGTGRASLTGAKALASDLSPHRKAASPKDAPEAPNPEARNPFPSGEIASKPSNPKAFPWSGRCRSAGTGDRGELSPTQHLVAPQPTARAFLDQF